MGDDYCSSCDDTTYYTWNSKYDHEIMRRLHEKYARAEMSTPTWTADPADEAYRQRQSTERTRLREIIQEAAPGVSYGLGQLSRIIDAIQREGFTID